MTSMDSVWLRIHDEPLIAGRVLLDALLVGGTSNLLTPLWSLQWEIIFSLLLPLYAWAAVRFGRRWYLVAGACLASSVAGVALHVNVLTYLPMFMLGALIAVHLPKLRETASRLSSPGFWWTASIVSTVALTSRWVLAGIPAIPSGLTILPATVGAAGIVLIAALWPAARLQLERPAVLLLGKISFSLYLIHEPIVLAVAQVTPPELMGWTPLVSVPLSVAVAYGFFRLIEAPSHGIAQSVRRRMGGASASTGPEAKASRSSAI